MWEYIKACIYGIIEGITEWLPVSSTGHLILLERILRLDAFSGASGEEYRAMFDVVIQLGAMLAVVFTYAAELLPLRSNRRAVFSLWYKLALATLPAAAIGFGADRLCRNLLGCDLDDILFTPKVVASALITYGILFIVIESLAKKNESKNEVTRSSALAIGFFQALAIVPGTSRSGATILGARILGIPRQTAARFSFFAAIPVISAASLLKIYDFAQYASSASFSLDASAYLVMAVAFAVAFAVSLVSVRFLTDFVKRHSFIPFGIYRIALGSAVLLLIK